MHNQKKIRIPVLGHVILPRVTLEVVDKSWLILLSLSLSYADPATAWAKLRESKFSYWSNLGAVLALNPGNFSDLTASAYPWGLPSSIESACGCGGQFWPSKLKHSWMSEVCSRFPSLSLELWDESRRVFMIFFQLMKVNMREVILSEHWIMCSIWKQLVSNFASMSGQWTSFMIVRLSLSDNPFSFRVPCFGNFMSDSCSTFVLHG